MLPTVEVRWFLKLEPPARPALFSEAPNPGTRTDWYARPYIGSGVKIREGNLELKLLRRSLGPSGLGSSDPGGAVGKLEEWRKWTYPGHGAEGPHAEQLEDNGWIPVRKTRSVLYFSVTESGAEVVPERPANGCQFEWTEVDIHRQRWLTIGFEAFGNATELVTNLTQTAARVLGELPGSIRLSEEDSCSYPEWLNGIESKQG